MKNNKPVKKTEFREYVQAFLDYLRRPKTVFDIKDRSKMLLILAAAIIILQKVVKFLAD